MTSSTNGPPSKRGRRINDSLPPSRSRDIQRAFRARRAAYIAGLEDRVKELEVENRELKIRLGQDPGPLSEEEEAESPPAKKRPRTDSEGHRMPSYSLRVGPNARKASGASTSSTAGSAVDAGLTTTTTTTAAGMPITRPAALAVAIPASQPEPASPFGYYAPLSPAVSSYPPGIPPPSPLYAIPSSSALLTGSPLSVVSAPPAPLGPTPSTGTPDGEQLPFWFDRSSLPPTPGEGSFSFEDQRRFVLSQADHGYHPSRSSLAEYIMTSSTRPPPLSPHTSAASAGSSGASQGQQEDGSPGHVHVKMEDDHGQLVPVERPPQLSLRDGFLWNPSHRAVLMTSHHPGGLPTAPDAIEPFGYGYHTSPLAPPFQTPPQPATFDGAHRTGVIGATFAAGVPTTA